MRGGLVSRKNTDITTIVFPSMSVSQVRVKRNFTCAASLHLNHRGKVSPSGEQLVSASEGPIETSQPDLSCGAQLATRVCR